MQPDELIAALKRERVPHDMIAQALGRQRPAATKLMNGTRSLKAHEITPLIELLNRWRLRERDTTALFTQPQEPDLPNDLEDENRYVPIEVLPTFAGMGGGGTGEGTVEKALVPRYLVEHVFRGRPSDFVVVRTRGDSMEPDFCQDDELLCDKRDRSPVQPGPFAIYDAEEGAYVVKNVEKMSDGRVRIFSSNSKYTPAEVQREETHIIGRPVWFGRRL